MVVTRQLRGCALVSGALTKKYGCGRATRGRTCPGRVDTPYPGRQEKLLLALVLPACCLDGHVNQPPAISSGGRRCDPCSWACPRKTQHLPRVAGVCIRLLLDSTGEKGDVRN